MDVVKITSNHVSFLPESPTSALYANPGTTHFLLTTASSHQLAKREPVGERMTAHAANGGKMEATEQGLLRLQKLPHQRARNISCLACSTT